MRRWVRERSGRKRRTERSDETVAFFGLFGVGNIGNEASLEAGLSAARRLLPAARLVCVCDDPEAVAAQHDVDALSINMSGLLGRANAAPKLVRLICLPIIEVSRWAESFRFARRVRQIIVPGTGILDDFGVRPYQMPYDLFRWSLIAKLAGTPFSFVSVGAGPIDSRASRWLMRSAVRLASSCSYRDLGSRDFMVSIGGSTIARPLTPDIVFALPRPIDVADDDGRRPKRPVGGSPMTVGLGVMAYSGWTNDWTAGEATNRRYIDGMADIASALLDAGSTIRVLVGEDADVRAIGRLRASIRSRLGESGAVGDGPLDSAGVDDLEARVIVEPATTMRELLVQIGRTDAVIATRFHNVVGALMMERPVVSIGYADKNAEVMDSMGLGAYCHDADQFDAEAVLADLDAVLERWDALAPYVAQQNVTYVRQVEEHLQSVILGDDQIAPDWTVPDAPGRNLNGVS